MATSLFLCVRAGFWRLVFRSEVDLRPTDGMYRLWLLSAHVEWFVPVLRGQQNLVV